MSIMFITHDLEEPISLSDRVIILSAGPSTHPLAEFRIDLPRPRPLEVTTEAHFFEIVGRIKSTIYGDVDQATNTGKYEIDRFAH